MEKITIELPIVKVKIEDPWCGCDYGKEHYEKGLFVIDDGIARHFAMWDGLSLWNCLMPHDLIDKYIVERAISDNDEVYHRDMEAIEERLSHIARMVGECRDKCDGVINNFVEVRDDLIDTIDEKFSVLPRSSGEGVNLLDVARAAAVIQKPELIKELNK